MALGGRRSRHAECRHARLRAHWATPGTRDATTLEPQTHGLDDFPRPGIPAGNRVSDLENGDEIFPAMLQAIRGATTTITFETYIYWSGDVGARFAEALAERLASKAHWGELLRAGVEIHEYQPTMIHNKLLVVDGLMTSVGSTNFDIRSFRLNDEASLNVYDADLAARMTEVFEADLESTVRYSYRMWKDRPLREKLFETFLLPIKSQL